YRQISPDRFFSAEALQRARSRAPRNRGADDSADRQDLGDEVVAEGGFVAIYAAQPHEPTIELHLPPDDPHGEWRGLLTFTIARTLLASRGSITYRELTQRVHSHYVAGLGRLGPTPLIEGNGQDRLVLGDGTERPSASFILSTRDDVVWTINAGKLHGAWRGSVFSVHPPPGQQDSDAPLGHVRVTTAQLARSDVKPIAFDGVPRNGDLPLGAECRPVALAQAAVSLRVGVSATANEEQSKSLAVSLKAISAELSSISVVEDSSRAEWIVGVDESGRAALAPVAGWPFGSSDSGVAVGPGGVAESREWMAESLGRIARATGLLKVCGARSRRSPLASSSACIVSAALKHHDESNDRKLEWSTQGLRLNDKDVVILEVTNRSRFAVDYSVLFVDSQFGVHVLFPEPGLVVDNRIAPGQTANVGPLEIDGSTLGIEHLVVIASRAEGLPLDWSWLAQSALESSTTRAGAAQLSFESELGALLHDSMFTGASANRGLRVIKADAVATRVITWQTNGKSP
ncbi:MAG: hypothetical protein QF805_28335, partial [Pirellulaceae bacterium]|nr:hypothetical protein [Pirellulaceae bacterium]